MPLTADQIAHDKAAYKKISELAENGSLVAKSITIPENTLVLYEIAWQLAKVNEALDALNLNIQALQRKKG
jgi:hypothetical protein